MVVLDNEFSIFIGCVGLCKVISTRAYSILIVSRVPRNTMGYSNTTSETVPSSWGFMYVY